MKRPLRYIAIALFAFLSIVIFISCPADPIQPGNSGTIPYESPYAPKNVKASCGAKDTLTISWDAVENADMYIIYGIEASKFGSKEMEEYARTNSTSYTFNLNGSGSGSYRLFDPDESYIFSVETWINYGSSTDNLISAKSQYVEGCFAPTTIDFYAVVTYNKLRLYWSCGNLFSTLNTTNEITTLYDPIFTVEYRDAASSSDTWTTLKLAKETDQYAEIDTSDQGLVYGNNYVFRVSMQIKGKEEGTTLLPEPIRSNDKTVLIDTSLTPKDVTDLTVSQGEYSDHIRVSWTIPTWGLDVGRSNSYFKVYRSESPNGPWTNAVVDEMADTQNPAHSNLIKEGEGGVIYFDDIVDETKQNSPRRGKKYYYKVINGASDGSTLYSQPEEEVKAISNDGFVFSFDESTELIGTWNTTADNLSASVKLDYTSIKEITIPSNLEYKIIRDVWHVDLNDTTEDADTIVFDSNEFVSNFDESLNNSCSICHKNTEHNYSYYLVIFYKETGELVPNKKVGDIFADVKLPFDFNGTETTIGQKITEFRIRDFMASDDFIGAINLTWTEFNPSNVSPRYSYKIVKDGELDTDSWTSAQVDTSSCSYLISGLENGTDYTIYLKAEYDGQVEQVAPVSTKGHTFDLTKITFDTISKGQFNDHIDLTWVSTDAFVNSDKLKYFINIKVGDELKEQVPISALNTSYAYQPSIEENMEDFGKTVTFSISAYNVIQGENIKTSSQEGTGYILPVPQINNVSKGYSRDSITVEWNKPENEVGGFSINVYSNSSLSGDPIGMFTAGANDTSYTIKSLNNANLQIDTDYFFSISSISASADSEHDNESLIYPASFYEYPDPKNGDSIRFDDYLNVGYIFDNTALTKDNGITFDESLDDASGYISEYFVIKIPVNKTLDRYTIIGADTVNISGSAIELKGEEEIYNIADLKYSEESGVYSNASGVITSDSSGYFEYDPSENIFTINSATGILNDSHVIGRVTINGSNSVANLTTNPSTTDCNVSRGMNIYDYINILNRTINSALHEINTIFKDDWVEGGLYSDKIYGKSSADKLYAEQAHGWGIGSTCNDGVISFNEYSPVKDKNMNVILNSGGQNLGFTADNQSVYSSNALVKLGPHGFDTEVESSYGTVEVSFTINDTSYSKGYKFRPIYLIINEIVINGSHYNVRYRFNESDAYVDFVSDNEDGYIYITPWNNHYAQ